MSNTFSIFVIVNNSTFVLLLHVSENKSVAYDMLLSV